MIIFFKPCFSCVYIKIQKQPQEVSCKKKVFLESSRNSQENSCPRASFLIKLHVACNFIKKEALAQVFSCEFCEIFKNTFSQNTSGQLLLKIVLVAEKFECKIFVDVISFS